MRISYWSSDVCSSDLKNQSDGWGRNVFTGKKEYYSQDFNVRGKLLFTPGDATEITLSGNYTDFDHHNVAAQNPPGAVLATGQGYLGRYKTRSEEHTSELQSLMRTSYAVFCLKNKHNNTNQQQNTNTKY